MSFARSVLGTIILVWLSSHGISGAANYYVSALGNDTASGTSPSAAWKSLARVSRHQFTAGDRILLEGQETFRGKLLFDASDRGTTNRPIVVTSYGLGRATLFAETETAIFAHNCSGILISNLNLLGAGPAINRADGISFFNDLPGDIKLPEVVIDHVEVSGFGGCGIALGGWNQNAGFRDVRITGSSMHDNRRAGILVYAQQPCANENIYIAACRAYNNHGDPSATGNTGSGITLGGVRGGIVERCVAYNNGRNNLSPHEGPAGIWAYYSSDVLLQFNESHHNRTGSIKDGAGFDLDISVTNSIIQYNYSHDNDGAGFLLCSDGTNRANVVRYNISQNDARKNRYGAIHVWGPHQGAEIYHNTIFLSPSAGSPSALAIETPSSNIRIRNNIFQTTGGARLLDIDDGQENLLIQGNDYWPTGAPFQIKDGNATFNSLESWRAQTGRERIQGTPTGRNVDPKLTNPGKGGTFNNAWLLGKLNAYKLLPTSLLIGAGVNLPLTFEEDTGAHDFYTNSIPQQKNFDIGAHELPY